VSVVNQLHPQVDSAGCAGCSQRRRRPFRAANWPIPAAVGRHGSPLSLNTRVQLPLTLPLCRHTLHIGEHPGGVRLALRTTSPVRVNKNSSRVPCTISIAVASATFQDHATWPAEWQTGCSVLHQLTDANQPKGDGRKKLQGCCATLMASQQGFIHVCKDPPPAACSRCPASAARARRRRRRRHRRGSAAAGCGPHSARRTRRTPARARHELLRSRVVSDVAMQGACMAAELADALP